MSANTAQIKEKIPYGGIKEIAAKANVSIFTVSRVISGKSKNVDVLKAMTKYLKELKSTSNELTELLND